MSSWICMGLLFLFLGNPSDDSKAIRIINGRDSKPIPGAKVSFYMDSESLVDPSGQVLTSSSEGLVPLGKRARGKLKIEAEGYVGIQGTFSPYQDIHEISLFPAGDLALTLRDGNNQPVEGLRVLLLPPVNRGVKWNRNWRGFWDGKPWNGISGNLAMTNGTPLPPRGEASCLPVFSRTIQPISWMQETDSSGKVSWSSLPALEGYRWGLLEEIPVEVNPPHEGGRLIKTSKKTKIEPNVPNLSGKLSVHPGVGRQLKARVFPGTKIKALLDLPGASISSVQVDLFHLMERGTIRDYVHEASFSGLIPGDWESDPILPGNKKIFLTYRDDQRNIYFFQQEFSIAGGQVVDLGANRLGRMQAFELDIHYKNELGGRISPASLFPGGEPGKAHLTLTDISEKRNNEDRMQFEIQVPVGVTYRFHGLPEGMWGVAAGIADPERKPEPPFQITGRRNSGIVLMPGSSGLDLPIIVQSQCKLQVSVPFPQGEEPFPLRLILLSEANRDVIQEKLTPGKGNRGGVVARELVVPQGTYEIFVLAVNEYGEGKRNWFAHKTIDTKGKESIPLAITLEEGAKIKGRTLRRDGSPMDGTLNLVLSRKGKKRRWVEFFYVRTDSDGNFLIQGLPPHHEFSAPPQFEEMIRTGAKGEVTEVELKSRF